MNSANTYAVLIGINEYEDKEAFETLNYAVKDCVDFYAVLTQFCGVPEDNIKVLRDEAATKDAIQRTLHAVGVQGSGSKDTVILFFSGHGFFETDENTAFLSTHDTSISAIREYPEAGLQMAWIREKIFQKSESRNVILILDCCHSGAMIDTKYKGDKQTEQELLVKDFHSIEKPNMNQKNNSIRAIICACSANSKSRETSTEANGKFTFYLLQGLRGEAVDKDGDVTLLSLIEYINKLRDPQRPEFILKEKEVGGAGNFIFYRAQESKLDFTEFELNVLKQPKKFPELQPLENPLDKYWGLIEKIVNRLSNFVSQPITRGRMLDTITRASGGDFAFSLQLEQGKIWKLVSYSEVATKGSLGNKEILKEFATDVAQSIDYRMRGERKLSQLDQNFYLLDNSSGKRAASLIAPLKANELGLSEFVVIGGLPPDSIFLSDIYRHVIAILLHVSDQSFGTRKVDLTEIEAALFDGIRKTYGYVSSPIYHRRHELFTKMLTKNSISFEPMLLLDKDPKSQNFFSWEALARDFSTWSQKHISEAPKNIFSTAELWGWRFITELDTYFFQTAIERFMKALETAKLNPKSDGRLSVNVYPDTLMHEEYFEAVKSTINESGFAAKGRLCLEISEKTNIPPIDGKRDIFKERLQEFKDKLGVSFAIDDFGVGYASASRLARLNPTYVKIDREILMHPGAESTIRYVVDMVSKMSKRTPEEPSVVIEGYDGSSALKLDRLFRQMKIRLVQGHFVGLASPELYSLDEAKRKEIADELRGKGGRSPKQT